MSIHLYGGKFAISAFVQIMDAESKAVTSNKYLLIGKKLFENWRSLSG
jgi:hypothetical protein